MNWNLFARDLRRLGRYDLLGRLGKGAAGLVYKGRDRDTGELVAIKVLGTDVAHDPVMRRRFEQEFVATQVLDSPHVVRSLDFGAEGPALYLVMEFVPGPSLWDHIVSRGRLPEAEAVPLICQVGQALHQAHERGLVHRDVKPDNVLLTADGTAKLLDFGLVKDLDGGLNLTETHTALGTPNFMAPEQFEDAKTVDRRSDVYGLAATLYMAVTGEVPFRARSYMSMVRKKLNGQLSPPRELAPELTPQTDWVILRALSVNPGQRPASCQEFLEALLKGRPEWSAQKAPAPARPAGPPKGSAARAAPERRATVRYPCPQDGACRCIGAEQRYRWRGQVRDISAGGIGLVLPRRFEPGAVLTVELPGADPRALRRFFVVRVVRAQKQEPRRWLVGCQFLRLLTQPEIAELQ